MRPLSERKILITGDPFEKGYERVGEDHSRNPLTEEEIDIGYEQFAEIYEYVLSDYINNHVSEFQNIHEIDHQ